MKRKQIVSLLLSLVFAVSLVPALPVTAHAMTLQENLSASFESFRIDGTTDVLSGKYSGTGSGGGTWEVSAYDLTSTESIVRIELNNYVGENIYIEQKEGAASRAVVIATRGTCEITGHLISWPGIWYNSTKAASLGISVKDQLTIRQTDCGIRIGDNYNPINQSGLGEAFLYIQGGGSLNIEARLEGIRSLTGEAYASDRSIGFGRIDITGASVSVTCTASEERYGIVTGGVHDELIGGWIHKGLTITDGASLKVQMSAGSHALRHPEVCYILGDDYLEDGNHYGDYWYVRPRSSSAPHAVTVINGTADRSTAKKGEKITITAGAPPEGKVFDSWTRIQGEGSLADRFSAVTTFTMPDGDVTFQAEWKDKESDTDPNATHTVTSDALTVRDGPDSDVYGRIGGLHKGDEVQVVETQGEWSRIVYGSGYGWVKSQYLAPRFAFTAQPVSGTAKKTEDYAFSWAANTAPDSVYLNIWYPEMNTWSSQSMTTDPATWNTAYYDFFAEGNVSRYRIEAIKGSARFYSDEFTVTWTEEATALAFTEQPQSGTVKKTEDYAFSWATNAAPDSVYLNIWYPEMNTWSSQYMTTDPATWNTAYYDFFAEDNVSRYRIEALKGSERFYSDEFTVTWTDGESAPAEFTRQPASGTAKQSEKYTFSWELSGPADGVVLYSWIPEIGEWGAGGSQTGNSGSLDYHASLCEGNVSRHKLHVSSSDGPDFFSDEFTVTWTEDDTEQANPFSDVTEGDLFHNAVLWAYYHDPQITDGMTDTTFGPELTVTRGQCVTFLWRAMGKPMPSTHFNPFQDVAMNDYYYDAVLWAVEKGITNGVTDTTFAPNATLSTQHIVTFLYRTLNPGKDGWDGEAAAWAGKDDGGKPFGVDIDVNNKTDCPRWCVVQFLYKTVK